MYLQINTIWGSSSFHLRFVVKMSTNWKVSGLFRSFSLNAFVLRIFRSQSTHDT